MKRFTFTQQRIEKLEAPDKGRDEVFDTKVEKLGCRVSYTGNKSFIVLKWDGRTSKRVTLGRFPDVTVAQARKLAERALTQISDGQDPTEEKRKQRYRAMSLQELLDTYLKDKKTLRPATVRDYKEKIRNGFPDWLNKPINEITRDMVKARRNKINSSADNYMRVLRALMKYAVKTLHAIENNPTDILTEGKLWGKPTRRKRTIASDNLKDWYQAVLNLDNEKAKVYLLLLLYTGLRDKDIRTLKWCDVDFDNDCFIARDTKNHTDFTAYIAPQVKPFLRSLKASVGHSKYVFPGNGKTGMMDTPRKPIQRIIEQTGIEFSPHDLKRTFLTLGESAMIPFSLLKALANHKTDNDITGGYIHAEAKTRKEATFKIADLIQQYATPEQNNVVNLKKGVR